MKDAQEKRLREIQRRAEKLERDMLAAGLLNSAYKLRLSLTSLEWEIPSKLTREP